MISPPRFLYAASLLAASTAAGELIQPEHFDVPEGMEVTVWATSPMFYNPTNFDVDERGRIWVAEAVNYRKFKNKGFDVEHPEGDRVVWLEDTDGDGKADKSQVFVQDKDLVAPLGIAVFGNRVLVAAAPHMVQYTDVDRNGVFDPKVDKKEMFLTGFGGEDHDHSLHSISSGPDGQWYFNAGNAGPHIVTDKAGWTLRAGSSYNGGAPSMGSNKPRLVSDDGRMWVGGVALRIKPDGTGMTPIGHNFRNSYEECVTSWGDVFQNDNDDPPACRTTWLMEYGNLGFASADGTRTWRADQNPWQDVATAEWRQDDPGTIPAGDIYGNGSPTGICYYENGALGEKWENLLLSCEAAKRVIYGYFPKPKGAGFELERFDFMKAKPGKEGAWFRPSDVGVGHDGAIYVADWYDPGVGGHRMTDRSASGTIYRVAPKGFKPVNPKVDLATTEGAVAALASPANNVRWLGFEKLHALGEGAVFPLLQSKDPWIKRRAGWVSAHFAKGKFSLWFELTSAPEAQDRVLAFRALRRVGEDVVKLANEVADDESPAVRREAMLALRDVEFEKKEALLVELASEFDGGDRWYLEAIGTAAEGDEEALWAALTENKKLDPLGLGPKLAGIAWRLHPAAAVFLHGARAMSETVPVDQRKKAIVALSFTADRSAAFALSKIANEGPEDLREYANWYGHQRIKGDWKELDVAKLFPRPVPIREREKNGARKSNKDVIKVRGSMVFQSAIARGDERVPIDVDIAGATQVFLVTSDSGNGISSDWGTWIEPRFVDAEGNETKVTDIPWSEAGSEWGEVRLNRAAGGGKMSVGGQPVAYGIGCHANGTIRYDIGGRGFVRLVAKGGLQTEKKSGSVRFEVYKLKAPTDGLDVAAIAKMKGVPRRGQAIFAGRGTCFACHTHGEIGRNVGPDMAGIGEKFGKDVILDHIINPNASIAFGYETWTIKTKAGVTLSGFLVSDADPVVLKDAAGGEHTVAKKDISSREQGKISIMPPAAALGLKPQDLADIAAFLTKK